LLSSFPSVEEDVVAKKIADSELRGFALVGARARLGALQAEVASLLATFPELRGGKLAASETPLPRASKPGRKRPMSAAEKKAVSERMRKYWADRRAGKR
jgi:hypothetical protein